MRGDTTRWARFIVLLFLLTSCSFSRSVANVPGTIPSGAAHVQVFVEPGDGVLPVVQFIDDARHTLDVAMYLLTDRDVVKALERGHQRGVRERIMLEEHPYGYGPGNRTAYNKLKSEGINVIWSSARFRLSHDKYAIADGTVALIGTANWTTSAFSRNREYIVEDSSATDAAQLEGLFNADWQRQGVQLNDQRLVVSPTNSRTDLVNLIGSAQHNLHIEAEEMQDPGIETDLADAARRGVHVEVILPRANPGTSDTNARGRRIIGAAGVQVRTLRTPYMHAKEIVVDGHEAFVGSENFSRSSLNINREVGILINDSAAIQKIDGAFDHDWSAARR